MGGTRPANGECRPYYDNIGPVQLYINEDGCPSYGKVTDPDAALDYINDCPPFYPDASTDDASADAESDAAPE